MGKISSVIVSILLAVVATSCGKTGDSCKNGVKDQQETGVDCGGSCAACNSCANGVIDQNETDVDCGGVCSPCASSITRIKTINYNDGRVDSLVYDNQNRILNIYEISGNEWKYTYSTNKVEVLRNGIPVETYILNSSGYPSKKYIQSSTGDYTDSISMTYDSDGYILSSSTISFGYTSKYTFTWSNGNLISKQDSTGLNFERYTYYTDKINTVGNENKGMFFLGMKSKNLVKNYSGSIGGSIDHSYEFDTRNRVKKETAIGANTNISTYTYY